MQIAQQQRQLEEAAFYNDLSERRAWAEKEQAERRIEEAEEKWIS